MERGLGRVVSIANVNEERGTHWAQNSSCPEAEGSLGDHNGHMNGCQQLQCSDLGRAELE